MASALNNVDTTPKPDQALTRDVNPTESSKGLPAKTFSAKSDVQTIQLTWTTRITEKATRFFVAFGRRIEAIPFGVVSIAGGIVSGLVIYIAHLKLGWSRAEGAILELWALTFALLLETMAKWTRAKDKYKELRPVADKLLNLNRAVPDQLESYVQMSITNKIEALIDLSVGRSSDCTYPEQIAIATSLAAGASIRFWATSTDRPSVLWGEGISYFNVQGDLQITDPAGEGIPPGRARLVMLNFDSLFEDYTVNSEAFNEFVAWHNNHEFALRFYLIPANEDLREKLKRTVNDTDPLRDFLIKDEAFVYGRIDTLGGSGVRLKFIPHRVGENMDIFNSYKMLFTNLWHQAAPKEKVLGQLEFERGKRSRHEQARKDFKTEFIDAPSGESFFKEMLNKIRNVKETLYAVDLADKKSSINNWCFQTEYKQWLQACLDAARKEGVDAKRIYILRAFGALTDFELQQVLRLQLEAGFEIVLIDEANVAAGNLYVDDFLLMDHDLGFTLGPESSNTFVQDSLEFSKNLIPKNSLETYRQKFDELLKYDKAEHFKGKGDIERFEEFLKNIGSKSIQAKSGT